MHSWEGLAIAIPSNFTVAETVEEALKRGGIVSPSATQITEATDYQLREVAKDIHAKLETMPLLLTTAVDTCVVGQSVYAWPTDAYSINSVVLLNASDDFTGTAQSGGATSITLAADFTSETETMQGRWIVITGGTGVDQIRQIVNYDDSTKVVTVDAAWTTNPAVSSTYMIPDLHRKLFDQSKAYHYDYNAAPYDSGMAVSGSMHGREIWLDRAPDRAYVIWWDYWADIDRIDVTGTIYLRLIRDYFNIFIEGIAAKVMDRYDEDRAQGQAAKYHSMLEMLTSRTATVRQVLFNDV